MSVYIIILKYAQKVQLVLSRPKVKVILYSYFILKKVNERITDSYYCNKYT